MAKWQEATIVDEPQTENWKSAIVLDESQANITPDLKTPSIADPQDVTINAEPVDYAQRQMDFLGKVDLPKMGWNQQHEDLLRQINKDPEQERAKIENTAWLASELNVSPDQILPVYDKMVKQIWPDENLTHTAVQDRIRAEQGRTNERYNNFLTYGKSKLPEGDDFNAFDIYPRKGGMLRNVIDSPAGQIGKRFAKGALNIGYNVQRVADGVADFTTGGFAGRSLYSEMLDNLGLEEASLTMRRWRDSPEIMTDDIAAGPFTRLFGMTTESLPYTAAMAFTHKTGGPLFALALGIAVEGGDVYDQLRLEGVPVRRAAFIALVAGTLSAEIEQRIAARNVKFAKGGSVANIRAFARSIAEKSYDKAAKVAGKFTVNLTTTSTINALEEDGQYLIKTIIPGVAVDNWPKNPDGTIAWAKMSKELGDSFAAGFMTSAIMGVGGRVSVSLANNYHKVIDMAFKDSKVIENDTQSIKLPNIDITETEADRILSLSPDEKNKAIEELAKQSIATDETSKENPESKTPAIDTAEKQTPKRFISDESYNEAKKIMRETRLNSGLDPEQVKAALTIGAYHFENGLRNFVDWSKKLYEQFGEKIMPHLDDMWDKVVAQQGTPKEKALTQKVKEIKKTLTRRSLINQVNEEIKQHDLYQNHAQAEEHRTSDAGTGFRISDNTIIQIGKDRIPGEVTDFLEGKPLKNKIMKMLKPYAKAPNLTSWDKLMQEAGLEGDEGDFIRALYDQVESWQTSQNSVNESHLSKAIDDAQTNGDMSFEILALKKDMLDSGKTTEEINSAIIDLAENYGIDKADIQDELVSDFQEKATPKPQKTLIPTTEKGFKKSLEKQESNYQAEIKKLESKIEDLKVQKSLTREDQKIKSGREFDSKIAAHQKEINSLKEKIKNLKEKGKQRLVEIRQSLQGKKTIALQETINKYKTKMIKARFESKSKQQTLKEKAAEKLAQKEDSIDALRQDFRNLKLSTKEETTKIANMRQRLVEYAKKNLPLSERGKLLTKLKNLTNIDQLKEAIDYAQELSDTFQKTTLRGKITSLFNKIQPTKKDGITKGKMTADIQNQLKIIQAHLHDDPMMVQQQSTKNFERLANKEIEYDEFMELQEALSMAGIDGMEVKALQNAYDEIKNIITEGKTIQKAKREARKERIAQIRQMVFNVITGGKGLKAGTYSLSTAQLAAEESIIKKIDNVNFGWYDLMDVLSKFDAESKQGKSELSNFAGGEVLQSETMFATGEGIYLNQIRDKMTEIFGTKNKSELNAVMNSLGEETDLGNFLNADGEEINLKMTRDQMIKKYMEAQDPTLADTIFGFVDESGKPHGMRWTGSMVTALGMQMTTQEKALGEWQLQFYNDYYKTVNAVYREIYGVDLPYNPYYSPIARETESEVPEYLLFAQEAFQYASTVNGSLKERVRNVRPIKFNGATEVLYRHIMQMEHFKAWSNTIQDLRSVFTNREVRNAIKQYHGKQIMSIIDEHINDMARGSVHLMKIVNLIDQLRVNFSKAILGFKPTKMLPQLSATLAYMTEMDMGEFVSGIADFWNNPVANFNFMKQNSGILAARWGEGFERDIKAAKQQTWTKNISQKMSFSDLSFVFMQAGDKLATVQGSWAKYQAELKKNGGDTAKAMREAELSTLRTQNTAEISSLSPLQRGGSFWKLLTMFQNDTNKYYRIISNNIRNMRYGRVDPPEAIKNILMAWVILPMFYQWVADAFRWRWNKQLRAAAMGPLNKFLILGNIIDWGIGQFLDKAFDFQATPVEGIATKFKQAATKTQKVISAAFDPDKNVKAEDVISAIESSVEVAGMAKGIPTPYAVQIEKAIRDKDPEQLFFTEYAITGGKKETKKFKGF